MSVDELINAVVSAAPLAGVYVVVGLGWVLLFRATKILNFATGQFIAFGAYLYYVGSSWLGLPFLIALVAALATMGLLAALMHVILMRPLAGQKGFAPVILMLGVSIVMQHVINVVFGGGARSLQVPLPTASLRIGAHSALTTGDFLILAVSLLLLFSAVILIRYSKWGIQMRAAAENTLLASQSGINVDQVFVVGWVATSVILTLMGISYGYVTVLTPDLANIGIRGLAPAIVGGIDSAAGVLPGAIVVALVENLAVLFLGERVRDAAVMVVLLAVLAIRPSGFLGTRAVTRI